MGDHELMNNLPSVSGVRSALEHIDDVPVEVRNKLLERANNNIDKLNRARVEWEEFEKNMQPWYKKVGGIHSVLSLNENYREQMEEVLGKLIRKQAASTGTQARHHGFHQT